MSFGIYKPGQGYWVRMLSAVGFGLLVLAGVAWLWSELDTIGRKGTSQRGSTELVTRLAAWGKANQHEIAGLQNLREAQLITTDNNRSIRLIDSLGRSYALDAVQFDAANVLVDTGLPPLDRGAALRLRDVERVSVVGDNVNFAGIPTFAHRNRLYIQSGTAAGVILLFGGVIFWALNKPKVVEFMIATEAEMRKVNWPTKREVIGSTWVVICGTFLMAFILLAVDMAFSELFINIRVLEGKSIFQQFFNP